MQQIRSQVRFGVAKWLVHNSRGTWLSTTMSTFYHLCMLLPLTSHHNPMWSQFFFLFVDEKKKIKGREVLFHARFGFHSLLNGVAKLSPVLIPEPNMLMATSARAQM